MKRTTIFLAAILLSPLAELLAADTLGTPPRKPNIVVILADDMPWKTGWVERVQHLDIDEGFELLVGHHVGTTAFPLFTIIRKPLTNYVIDEVHPLVEDCQNAAAGKPIATGGGDRRCSARLG